MLMDGQVSIWLVGGRRVINALVGRRRRCYLNSKSKRRFRVAAFEVPICELAARFGDTYLCTCAAKCCQPNTRSAKCDCNCNSNCNVRNVRNVLERNVKRYR